MRTPPDLEDRRRAVCDFGANLIVVAGAGTGKTSLLVGRTLSALLAKGLRPDRLLCTTFTEKAAQEMAERLDDALHELAGPGAPRDGGDAARWLALAGADRAVSRERARAVLEQGPPPIETFHGFAKRFLEEHLDEAGLAQLEVSDPIEDEDERRRIAAAFFRRAFEKGAPDWYGPLAPFFGLERLAEIARGFIAAPALAGLEPAPGLARARGKGEEPETLPCGEREQRALADFFSELADFARGERRRAGRLAFPDLLVGLRALLQENRRVRRRAAERYRHILVDEFQDTDPLQYEILFLLGRAPARIDEPSLEAGRLFIVGDPKQSIYRFRGADIEAYHEAVARLTREGAVRLTLRANFRSRPRLIRFANALFEPAFGAGESPLQPAYEELEAVRPEGAGRVRLIFVRASGRAAERRPAEARALAREIRAWVAAEEGRRYGDVAVLVRRLEDARIHAGALRAAGIPCVKSGGRGFFEREEATRFLALFAFVLRPWDPAALLACLRGPLGAVPDAELRAFADGDLLDGRLERLATAGPELRARLPQERLARAVDSLLALRARALAAEPPEAIRLLHDALAPIEAQLYDGEQRLENLAALCAFAVARCRAGRSLEEIEALLQRQAARSADFDEASLVDPELDAVRVMTIHKAKGLEFPLVVVPDLWSEHGRERPRSVRLAAHRPEPAAAHLLVLQAGDLRSPLLAAREAHDRRHREAESLRLFYVAVTRAREECWLSFTDGRRNQKPPLGGELAKATGTWLGHLRHLGLGAAFPDEPSALADGLVETHVLDAPAAAEPERAAAQAAPGDPVRVFEERSRRIAEVRRPPLEAPSRAVADDEAAAAGEGAVSAASFEGVAAHAPALEPADRHAPGGDARALGGLVHAYLAAVEPARTALDEPLLAACATGLGAEAALPEARARLERFHASDLGRRFATARILGREWPLLLADGPRRYAGAADLVLEEDGRLVLADYKVSALDPDEPAAREQLRARYAPQLRVYARALQCALEPPAPVRAELWLLGPQRAGALRIDP